MDIPKSFKIFGHTVKVRTVKKLLDDHHCFGRWSDSRNLIELSDDPNMDLTFLEQTFCHELVHAILSKIGKETLNADEEFVDLFGQALHQVLTSMKA